MFCSCENSWFLVFGSRCPKATSWVFIHSRKWKPLPTANTKKQQMLQVDFPSNFLKQIKNKVLSTISSDPRLRWWQPCFKPSPNQCWTAWRWNGWPWSPRCERCVFSTSCASFGQCWRRRLGVWGVRWGRLGQLRSPRPTLVDQVIGCNLLTNHLPNYCITAQKQSNQLLFFLTNQPIK